MKIAGYRVQIKPNYLVAIIVC